MSRDQLVGHCRKAIITNKINQLSYPLELIITSFMFNFDLLK